MTMSSPRPSLLRRWLLPAALCLAPKCLVCLAAATGLGTVLGRGGPELCGDPAQPSGWLEGLAPLAAGVVLAAWHIRRPAR